MIGASQHPCIALFVVAHQIGAVPAAVEEDPDFTVAAAHHQHGLQADLPSKVIAVLRQLAFVSEINPDLVPYLPHFPLEQRGVMIKAAVNAIRFDQFADIDGGFSCIRHDSKIPVLQGDDGNDKLSCQARRRVASAAVTAAVNSCPPPA